MKHTLLYIVSLLAVVSVSAQHAPYKGKITVTPRELSQKGDSLHIGILFDISGVTVSSRQSLTLVPKLVSGSAEKILPGVEIKGRRNYLISNRRMALMSKREKAAYDAENIRPLTTVKGYGRKNSKQIDYRLTIPFEPWMKESSLDMAENISSCGNKPFMLAVSQLINAVQLEPQKIPVTPYEVMPSLAYVRPHAEAVKRREIVGEAFLDFAVSKTDIRPEYMNNPRELKKITDMMEEVRNDDDVKVCGIYVIGYASPEGTLKFNQYLSEARATALVDYLTPRFDFPREMYHVQFGGENWQGLEEMVVASDIQYKDEILDILRNVPAEINYATNSSRKKSLMLLRSGNPYRYMLKEYYPSLRKAICKLDYEVREFNVMEARDLLHTRPQNLSLNEMYLVANLYEPGSAEFREVFEIAVRMFPTDPAANLNAAAAALARRDTATAGVYLDRIAEQTPEVLNARGVLYMLQGDYAQAEEALTKAAEAGSPEARVNLGELARKRENSKLLESQNN